jgi:glucosylceramidase
MKTARVSLVGLFFAVFAAACTPGGGGTGTGGTGATGAGGTGGSSSCAAGQEPCGTECVNLATDSNNCGACGIPCNGGRTCQSSQCRCPAGLLECSGSCVASDAAHCGSCTNVCSAGQVCSGGACTSTCAGTTCGTACCESNQTCTNNACVDMGGTAGTGGTTGTGGSSSGSAGTTGTAGTGGRGGGTAGSAGGRGGTTGTAGTGGSVAAMPRLITSAANAYWSTSGTLTAMTGGTATVTVNDGTMMKAFEGFGGSFNEMGWSYLMMLSQADRDKAMKLLFDGTDGANFVIARIPMGASDYALQRYTLNETAGDTAMTNFSISRDMTANSGLIPYAKAALAVRGNIRFWASPWTPPTWMKTTSGSVNSTSCANMGGNAYNGGCMQDNNSYLMGLAQYFVKFVQAYAAQGITIETVAPQNEPNYSQGYPSALWASPVFTKFVRDYLGPALNGMNVKIMLGTMSNGDNGAQSKDLMVVQNAMGDATARPFFKSIGLQWGMLDLYKQTPSMFDQYNIPMWASEHKCGNYPWNPAGYPAYNSTAAPNNHAYALESWGYIRDAIKAGVTAYNAWNMVLDTVGLGNDTVRDWRQNALLTVNTSSKTLNLTPTYHVFRHVSQYVQPTARVVATSGSTDAIAFKNPDGSIVAVMGNAGAANATYSVAIKGTRYQFSMPSSGWATVVVP